MNEYSQGFEADTGKILNIVINSLYSDRDIFLRELLSNASDAIHKRKFSGQTNPAILNKSDDTIEIVIDKKQKTIEITDSGIGLAEKELAETLGTIAKSGTSSFLEEMSENDNNKDAAKTLIGQFGVGFYSAFMVAEKVEIITKSHKDEFRTGPVCIVEQGRVAIGDPIGEALNASLVAVLIGERPGLSSPDSMGLYMTYSPRIGTTDERRNCISNIRPEGLPLLEAARRFQYLARQALQRKQQYSQAAADFETQLKAQKETTAGLRQRLTELENEVQKYQTKKQVLIARDKAAQATSKANEILSKTSTTGALSIMDRMEEKVGEKEARAAALAELGTDSLEDKFKDFEGDASIEMELLALKGEVPAGGDKNLITQDKSVPSDGELLLEIKEDAEEAQEVKEQQNNIKTKKIFIPLLSYKIKTNLPKNKKPSDLMAFYH